MAPLRSVGQFMPEGKSNRSRVHNPSLIKKRSGSSAIQHNTHAANKCTYCTAVNHAEIQHAALLYLQLVQHGSNNLGFCESVFVEGRRAPEQQLHT